MFCLVYGFSNAATHSWHTPSTWSVLAAAAALLIVFAARQSRAAQPLLPPRVILDRNRGGAYLTSFVNGVGIFGIFLFLIYYMQVVLGYSAVKSGVAMLPMVAVIGVIANVGSVKLLPRFGPRPLITLGLLLNAAGMVWLTRIGAPRRRSLPPAGKRPRPGGLRAAQRHQPPSHPQRRTPPRARHRPAAPRSHRILSPPGELT